MPNYVQYDKYTQPKEIVRKKIKQALISHNVKSFPPFDSNAEILEPIEDSFNEFRLNYKAAGGKHIVCKREDFSKLLVDLLKNQHYPSILNTSKSLSALLSQNGIQCYDSINAASPVDAAIVFADMLIARNGSMVFTQQYSLYPSVKGLAKDIIVVALAQNIVSDLKTAMVAQQQKHNGKLLHMTEIVAPTLPQQVEGKELFTPNEPRFILLLVI